MRTDDVPSNSSASRIRRSVPHVDGRLCCNALRVCSTDCCVSRLGVYLRHCARRATSGTRCSLGIVSSAPASSTHADGVGECVLQKHCLIGDDFARTVVPGRRLGWLRHRPERRHDQEHFRRVRCAHSDVCRQSDCSCDGRARRGGQRSGPAGRVSHFDCKGPSLSKRHKALRRGPSGRCGACSWSARRGDRHISEVRTCSTLRIRTFC